MLAHYHRGQVTVPPLVVQLHDLGIAISKRQVVRLRTGLETAGWITVDDTGARHKGANAVCT